MKNNKNQNNSKYDKSREIKAFYADTGEMVENITIMTDEDRRKRREFFEDNEKKRLSRLSNSNERFIQFLFTEFKDMPDLAPQTAIRLMYLATYLSYDENYLKKNGNFVAKKDIEKIMALKTDTVRRFLDEVVKNGYLLESEKGYSLSKNYFNMGKIQAKKVIDQHHFIRVYINAMRKLYLSTAQNKHIYLGYVFEIIPYINTQWNIVCHNPLEKNKEDIQPMTLGEFCDKIGYNKKNAYRFIKTLREIKFKWKGKDQLFCSYIYETNKCDMKFFVNPNVFYAGDNFSEVEVLGMFF